MAMQTTGSNESGEPMMDINTTPLIDVMLVLLIMFIITIPIQTHAVKLDLPVNDQNNPPPDIDPTCAFIARTVPPSSSNPCLARARMALSSMKPNLPSSPLRGISRPRNMFW